jgi:putative ABC transport system permease protein
MRAARRLRSGFATLFQRARRQAELDLEIQFHFESAIERFRERGLSEAEARRAARLEFGGVDAAKEGVRSAWTGAWLNEILGEARVAVRGFVHRPSYALAVVLTVALAIGGAGAVFNSLWAVLYRPLPFKADRGLAVLGWQARDRAEPGGLSPLEVADFRAAGTAFGGGLAEYHHMTFTLFGHGEPRRVRVGVVSANYFGLLGVAPLEGRDFAAADESPRAPAALLLSYRFWQDVLGGGNWVGADFIMNDRVHRVVGVLPPLPPAPDENDVFMPVAACPFRNAATWRDDRTARGLTVIARLRPNVEWRTATAEVEAIAHRLARAYPEAYPSRLGLRPLLIPLREALTATARPTLRLLGAAGLATLLLVAANLINLTLAQLARRESELAVRSALGASRLRIVRQLALEGCILALAGGGLGLLLTVGGQALLARLLGRLTPRAFEISPDWTTAGITLGMSLAVGLAIGLLPACQQSAAATAPTPLITAVRGEPPGGGARATRTRDMLVVAQVAGSFVLLIGAGLLLRSLLNLERVPAGFRHDGVLTVSLPINWTKYSAATRRLEYAERLLERTRAIPGVEATALADNYPLNSALPWNRHVAVGRVPPDPADAANTADFRTVSPDYFTTVGIPLLAGRPLRNCDRDEGHAVALVNAAFAREFFGSSDPLGKTLVFTGGTAVWTIVGVVGDVRQRTLNEDARPEVYAPLALRGGSADVLLVRAAAARPLLPELRAAIRTVDPGQPIAEVRTLAETRADWLAAPRTTALLAVLAALLALAIAVTGLAGLLAYSLGQRQHEFLIRQALGAGRGDIARLVFARAGALLALGALLGVAGALLATRGLRAMLFGLAVNDPQTYLAVALMFTAAAFGACLPALRRATLGDPSAALRSL